MTLLRTDDVPALAAPSTPASSKRSSQRATQAEKQQSAVAEDAAQGMAVKRQSRRRCDATGATSHLVHRHVAISGDSAEARLSILAQAPRSARLSKQKSARLGPRRPLAVAEPLRQQRLVGDGRHAAAALTPRRRHCGDAAAWPWRRQDFRDAAKHTGQTYLRSPITISPTNIRHRGVAR